MSFGALAGLLGGASSTMLGLFQTGLSTYNMYQQQQNYDTNYDWQRAVFGYNLGLQNTMFNREDTAVQRRVADLEAAGLSPVLAAGQPANAGPVIHTTAPERQRAELPDFLNSVMSLLKMKEDISNTVAQRDLIKAQEINAKSNTIKNLYDLEKTSADIANKNIDTAIKSHDYKIFKATGTTSQSGSVVKDLRNLFGASQSPVVKGIFGEMFDKISKDYQNNIDSYNKREQQRKLKRR